MIASQTKVLKQALFVFSSSVYQQSSTEVPTVAASEDVSRSKDSASGNDSVIDANFTEIVPSVISDLPLPNAKFAVVLFTWIVYTVIPIHKNAALLTVIQTYRDKGESVIDFFQQALIDPTSISHSHS